MLLTHVHDLLCLQLHTVGSHFLSVTLWTFPFNSSSYFGFTIRRYTVVFPMAHSLSPRAEDHGMKSYWFTTFPCLQLQTFSFRKLRSSWYAGSSGNFLQTFRDNLSVPSSGFKNTCFVTTQKNAVLMYFATEAWNYARTTPGSFVQVKTGIKENKND